MQDVISSISEMLQLKKREEIIDLLISLGDQDIFIPEMIKIVKFFKQQGQEHMIIDLKNYLDLAYSPGLRAHILDDFIRDKTQIQKELNEIRSKFGVYNLESKLALYKNGEKLLRAGAVAPVTQSLIEIAGFRGDEPIPSSNDIQAKTDILIQHIKQFELDYDAIVNYLIQLGRDNIFIEIIINTIQTLSRSQKALNILAEGINRSYSPGLRGHIIDDFIRHRLNLQEELNAIRKDQKIYTLEQKLYLYMDAERMLKNNSTYGATHAIMKVIEFRDV